MCKACPTSVLQMGLKHPSAGTCLHCKANLNLKSKVFPCLLRLVSSDPANTRSSDRWALAVLVLGLRVSQPPVSPCQATPGMPRQLHRVTCKSSALTHCQQHQQSLPLTTSLDGVTPGSSSILPTSGCFQGGSVENTVKALHAPFANDSSDTCSSSTWLCDFCTGLCAEISDMNRLAPYRSWKIRVQSRKWRWQSIITKSTPQKLRVIKKDMGCATLIEQPLQYADFNY